MSGNTDYLVDTNIIIYYLNGDEIVINWFKENKDRLSISIIALLEVLSYTFTEQEERNCSSLFRCISLV
jgi:predicted nucleic acid-binding protein